MHDSTTRFSDRVENYVRARPGYPQAIVDVLRDRGVIVAGSRVADVGAGTGISSRLFLEAGCEVIAIEPNEAMRAAADKALSTYIAYHSASGTAEETTLANGSVDLVVAAQAFHWFDRVRFRRECWRILASYGHVALIWNDRKTTGSEFLEAYEALVVRFGTDYTTVNHRNVGDFGVAEFFAPAKHEAFRCENVQRLDYAGLEARLLSSSYAPNRGSPKCDEMLVELRRMFDLNQHEGVVEVVYETQLYFGRLS